MTSEAEAGDRSTGRKVEKSRHLIPVRAAPSIIAEFQSDAVELEEKAPARIARLTLYGVTLLVLAAVAWASFSSIDEVVVAPGRLITTKPTIVVQPLETSIVRSIDVKVGDTVKAGQTLATLDPTFTQADVDQVRQKLHALDAETKRLETELDGRDYTAIAGSSPDEKLQSALYGQRRAFFMAQLQNYDQQIAARNSMITSGRQREAILIQRRSTLTRIESARQTLYQHETGSLVNMLMSRDARLTVDENLVDVHGKVDEAKHELSKLMADRQAFIEDFKRSTMEKLVDVREKRDSAAQELKKMELRRRRVVLKAPADAVVLELANQSLGSVVREAEPIVTLVPLDTPLVAEVSINTRDVGRVSTGEPVRVKVDAYPFQKYGTAAGTLATISRDSLPPDRKSDPAGAAPKPSAFRARVALDGKGGLVGENGKPLRLLPGMTVTAEIKVGHRRVISYFLYPLMRGLSDSIREP